MIVVYEGAPQTVWVGSYTADCCNVCVGNNSVQKQLTHEIVRCVKERLKRDGSVATLLNVVVVALVTTL